MNNKDEYFYCSKVLNKFYQTLSIN